MRQTRLHRCSTSLALCVAHTTVTPNSVFRYSTISNMLCVALGSRWLVGSSSRRTLGVIDKIAASATRCFSPLESSVMSLFSEPFKPTCSSASVILSLIASAGYSNVFKTKRNFIFNCRTEELILGVLKKKPNLFAYSGYRLRCNILIINSDGTGECTCRGMRDINPLIVRSNVVLPQPVGPVKRTQSPADISTLIPLSVGTVRLG